MISTRPASASDEAILGRLGGALARQHHAADPRRFVFFEHPEKGYGRFLVSQIGRSRSAVFVADDAAAVVGYVWATVEDTDWAQLRGPAGIVQDIFVDPSARGLGAGRALLATALDWIRSQGRGQAVLMTKTDNVHARRLFAAMGFRPTMTEMTLELDDSEAGDA